MAGPGAYLIGEFKKKIATFIASISSIAYARAIPVLQGIC